MLGVKVGKNRTATAMSRRSCPQNAPKFCPLGWGQETKNPASACACGVYFNEGDGTRTRNLRIDSLGL